MSLIVVGAEVTRKHWRYLVKKPFLSFFLTSISKKMFGITPKFCEHVNPREVNFKNASSKMLIGNDGKGGQAAEVYHQMRHLQRIQACSVNVPRCSSAKRLWKQLVIIAIVLLVVSISTSHVVPGMIGSASKYPQSSNFHQVRQHADTDSSIPPTINFEEKDVSMEQQASMASSDLINGTFNGIKYRYGNKTERYQGSFNQTITDIINETHVRSEVTSQSLYLIENWTLVDIFWKVITFKHNQTDNSNETKETVINNETFVNIVFPLILNGLLNDPNSQNDTQYALDWAIMIDQNDTPLLRIPVNVSYYNFVRNNDTEYKIYVQPLIFKVNLTWRLYEDIQVNTTEFLFVYAYIQSTYNLTYDMNISSVMVNIWHEPSLFVQVLGAGHYTFRFTELSATMMFYYVQALRFYQLTFANGSAVPWEMYPFELYPVNYTQQGISIEINYQEGIIRGASIQQSIVQSYLLPQGGTNNTAPTNETRDGNAAPNATDSSRLALWLIQTIPTFIGFRDNNHNGILDLEFSVDNGITIGSTDRPVLFGNAEAQERSVLRYRQRYQLYNASFQLLGLNISDEVQNQEINETFFNVEVEAIGDVDAFPEPQLTWNEPREVANGTYQFNFTIQYDNVPIVWQRIDGSNVTTTMDVGYNYVFTVNPVAKQARLSPTFRYGSVNLPGLSRPNVNISLAVPFLSEFLFLTPIQSLADSQQDLNKSKAAAIADVRLISGNLTLGEVNASGIKSFYKVGSTNIRRMKTSAMHLVDVTGVFTRSEATEFSIGSDAFKVVKNAILEAAKSNVSFALRYRSDIYLLNYPTWNGQEIEHDPTFSISYDAPSPPPESSGPEVILPTPTYSFTVLPEQQQQIQSTSPIVDVKELTSGFALSTFVITVVGVVLGLILSRGRKRLYV